MLNVTYKPFVLSVVRLNVVMLNVIMLSVVAPFFVPGTILANGQIVKNRHLGEIFFRCQP